MADGAYDHIISIGANFQGVFDELERAGSIVRNTKKELMLPSIDDPGVASGIGPRTTSTYTPSQGTARVAAGDLVVEQAFWAAMTKQNQILAELKASGSIGIGERIKQASLDTASGKYGGKSLIDTSIKEARTQLLQSEPFSGLNQGELKALSKRFDTAFKEFFQLGSTWQTDVLRSSVSGRTRGNVAQAETAFQKGIQPQLISLDVDVANRSFKAKIDEAVNLFNEQIKGAVSSKKLDEEANEQRQHIVTNLKRYSEKLAGMVRSGTITSGEALGMLNREAGAQVQGSRDIILDRDTPISRATRRSQVGETQAIYELSAKQLANTMEVSMGKAIKMIPVDDVFDGLRAKLEKNLRKLEAESWDMLTSGAPVKDVQEHFRTQSLAFGQSYKEDADAQLKAYYDEVERREAQAAKQRVREGNWPKASEQRDRLRAEAEAGSITVTEANKTLRALKVFTEDELLRQAGNKVYYKASSARPEERQPPSQEDMRFAASSQIFDMEDSIGLQEFIQRSRNLMLEYTSLLAKRIEYEKLIDAEVQEQLAATQSATDAILGSRNARTRVDTRVGFTALSSSESFAPMADRDLQRRLTDSRMSVTRLSSQTTDEDTLTKIAALDRRIEQAAGNILASSKITDEMRREVAQISEEEVRLRRSVNDGIKRQRTQDELSLKASTSDIENSARLRLEGRNDLAPIKSLYDPLTDAMQPVFYDENQAALQKSVLDSMRRRVTAGRKTAETEEERTRVAQQDINLAKEEAAFRAALNNQDWEKSIFRLQARTRLEDGAMSLARGGGLPQGDYSSREALLREERILEEIIWLTTKRKDSISESLFLDGESIALLKQEAETQKRIVTGRLDKLRALDIQNSVLDGSVEAEARRRVTAASYSVRSIFGSDPRAGESIHAAGFDQQARKFAYGTDIDSELRLNKAMQEYAATVKRGSLNESERQRANDVLIALGKHEEELKKERLDIQRRENAAAKRLEASRAPGAHADMLARARATLNERDITAEARRRFTSGVDRPAITSVGMLEQEPAIVAQQQELIRLRLGEINALRKRTLTEEEKVKLDAEERDLLDRQVRLRGRLDTVKSFSKALTDDAKAQDPEYIAAAQGRRMASARLRAATELPVDISGALSTLSFAGENLGFLAGAGMTDDLSRLDKERKALLEKILQSERMDEETTSRLVRLNAEINALREEQIILERAGVAVAVADTKESASARTRLAAEGAKLTRLGESDTSHIEAQRRIDLGDSSVLYSKQFGQYAAMSDEQITIERSVLEAQKRRLKYILESAQLEGDTVLQDEARLAIGEVEAQARALRVTKEGQDKGTYVPTSILAARQFVADERIASGSIVRQEMPEGLSALAQEKTLNDTVIAALKTKLSEIEEGTELEREMNVARENELRVMLGTASDYGKRLSTAYDATMDQQIGTFSESESARFASIAGTRVGQEIPAIEGMLVEELREELGISEAILQHKKRQRDLEGLAAEEDAEDLRIRAHIKAVRREIQSQIDAERANREAIAAIPSGQMDKLSSAASAVLAGEEVNISSMTLKERINLFNIIEGQLRANIKTLSVDEADAAASERLLGMRNRLIGIMAERQALEAAAAGGGAGSKTPNVGGLLGGDGGQNYRNLGGLGGFFLGGGLASMRYALPSMAMYGSFRHFKDIIKASQELEYSMAILEDQFDAVFGSDVDIQNVRSDIIDLAKETGIAADEIASMQVLLTGAFADQDIGGFTRLELVERQTESAAKIAQTIKLPFKEVNDTLQAASLSFRRLNEDIGDVAVGLEQQSGVSSREIVQFIGSVAPVFSEAGFTMEEAAAIGTVSAQRTGRNASSLAEAFGRVIPALTEQKETLLELAATEDSLNTPEFIQAIATSDIQGIFEQIGRAYTDASKEGQQAIIQALGGRREAQVILPALVSSELVEEYTDVAENSSGALEERFGKIQKTLQNQMERMRESFKALGVTIMESGLADVFNSAIKGAEVLMTILNPMISAVKTVNDLFGQWPVRMLAFVAALKVAKSLMVVGDRSILSVGLERFMMGGINKKLTAAAIERATAQGLAADSVAPIRTGGFANRRIAASAAFKDYRAAGMGVGRSSGAGALAFLGMTGPQVAITAGIASLLAIGSWVHGEREKHEEELKDLRNKLTEELGDIKRNNPQALQQKISDLRAQADNADRLFEERGFWRKAWSAITGNGEDREASTLRTMAVFAGIDDEIRAAEEALLKNYTLRMDAMAGAFEAEDSTELNSKLEEVSSKIRGYEDTPLVQRDSGGIPGVDFPVVRSGQGGITSGGTGVADISEAIDYVTELRKKLDITDQELVDAGIGEYEEYKKKVDEFNKGRPGDKQIQAMDLESYLSEYVAVDIREVLDKIKDESDPFKALMDLIQKKELSPEQQAIAEQIAEAVVTDAKSDEEAAKKLNELLGDIELPPEDVVARDIDTLRKMFDSGLISSEEFRERMILLIERKKSILAKATDSEELQLALRMDILSAQEGYVSFIKTQQARLNKIESILGASDGTVVALEAAQASYNLMDPNYKGLDNLLEAAEKVVADKQSMEMALALQSEDVSQIRDLVLKGVEVPPEAQGALRLGALEADPVFGKFKSQLLTMSETVFTEMYTNATKGFLDFVDDVPAFLRKAEEDAINSGSYKDSMIASEGFLPVGFKDRFEDIIATEMNGGKLDDSQISDMTTTVLRLISERADQTKEDQENIDVVIQGLMSVLGQSGVDITDFSATFEERMIQSFMATGDDFETATNKAADIINKAKEGIMSDFDRFNIAFMKYKEAVEASDLLADLNKARAWNNSTEIANITLDAAKYAYDLASQLAGEHPEDAEAQKEMKKAEAAWIRAGHEQQETMKRNGDARRGLDKAVAEANGNYALAAQYDIDQANADYAFAQRSGDSAGMDNASAARKAAEIRKAQAQLKARTDFRGIAKTIAEINGNLVEAADIEVQNALDAFNNAKGDDRASAKSALLQAEERARQARLEERDAWYSAFNKSVEQNPEKLAELQLAQARQHLEEARGTKAKLAAWEALVDAERQVESVMSDIRSARSELRQAELEAVGDSIGAAQVAAADAHRQLAEAAARGAGEAELKRLRAQTIRSDKAVRDAVFDEQMYNYKWLMDMGQITKSEYANYLEGLKSTLIPGTRQFKDLELTIKQLRDDIGSDLQHNLPVSLALPTLYEVRRLSQTPASAASTAMGGGVGYQDNRRQDIVVYVNNGMGKEEVVDVLSDALDGSRSGSYPRRY